jgi:hypothetical protein
MANIIFNRSMAIMRWNFLGLLNFLLMTFFSLFLWLLGEDLGRPIKDFFIKRINSLSCLESMNFSVYDAQVSKTGRKSPR